MTRDELLGLLTHDNVVGWLRLLRVGESSQDESAYTVLYGGSHFESFEDHPRIRFYEKDDEFIRNGKKDYTTAAGAYQITESTWNPLAKRYGLNDFGPTNQDIAALALCHEKGAIPDILAGRIREAVAKCSRVWASLPGAGYGQPEKKLSTLLKVYEQYGGRLNTAGTKSADPAVPATPVARKEKVMAPLLAFLPQILGAIPSLISVFGSPNDSEVAKRNQAAGVLVAETLVKATNAVNLQDAVEKIENDPEALALAKEAIDELLPQITDGAGGGVKAAREFADAHMDGRGGRVLEVITYAALLFLAVANGLALTVYIRGTDSSLLNTVIQADIGAALMALGFWLGTSASSQKKTAALVK